MWDVVQRKRRPTSISIFISCTHPPFFLFLHNPCVAPVRCTCTRHSFLPWMFSVAGTVTDPAVWEELYKKFLGMNYFVKAGVVQE